MVLIKTNKYLLSQRVSKCSLSLESTLLPHLYLCLNLLKGSSAITPSFLKIEKFENLQIEWQSNKRHTHIYYIYLSLFQDLFICVTFVEHLLHGLAFDGHSYSTSSDPSLNTNKGLHASKSYSSLFPHLPTSDDGLKSHQSFQSPQSPSCLKCLIIAQH